MTLNGSDAYLPVHDDSPFCIAFGSAQCGISRFFERTNTNQLYGDINWNVDIFQVCIGNVLTDWEVRKAGFKQPAKMPCPEMMIEVHEPS